MYIRVGLCVLSKVVLENGICLYIFFVFYGNKIIRNALETWKNLDNGSYEYLKLSSSIYKTSLPKYKH